MKTFSRKQKQQSFAIKLEERKSASNAQLKDVESRPIVFFLCEYFLFFYQIRNEIMFDA